MSAVILKVENLTTEFQVSEGRVRAVNDVSFAVKKGKILGIVGESGCGKSVTCLSIMQLLPKRNGFITGGKIIFEGKDLLLFSDKEMRSIRGNKISMIFQEPMTALNPVFTVGLQIGEVLELHQGIRGAKAREKCVELLSMVGIPRPDRVIDEYPHQLSGGMRQRVMIAMALSCNPALLIADEPTTALDVTIQAQVLELMGGLLTDLDMGMILITHDLGVIAEMADDVLVMYGGRIVEQAPVGEIFERPKHFYTKGLLSSRPSLVIKGGKLKSIRGMVPSLDNLPTGCAFYPRCDHGIDACTVSVPNFTKVGDEHFVRCVLCEDGQVVL